MSRHPVVRPDVLADFVEFVRVNPWIPADDPLLLDVFRAYNKALRQAPLARTAPQTGDPDGE